MITIQKTETLDGLYLDTLDPQGLTPVDGQDPELRSKDPELGS